MSIKRKRKKLFNWVERLIRNKEYAKAYEKILLSGVLPYSHCAFLRGIIESKIESIYYHVQNGHNVDDKTKKAFNDFVKKY